MKIKELINYKAVLKNPLQSAVHYASREFSYKYFLAELVWYLSGDRSSEYIGKFAKLWKAISDEN